MTRRQWLNRKVVGVGEAAMVEFAPVRPEYLSTRLRGGYPEHLLAHRGLAASVPGVGALAASAILASAPDPQAFKSGRDFAAWLGATPKRNSMTGGKEKFGSD